MSREPAICVIGDTHGHLQLGLCMAARWQRELGTAFEAVLLCGDVGTFTAEDQLDNATRRHAKANPCELEFLYQWAAAPQPPWLAAIFADPADGGLGLDCPVIMVHGNHEGFDHLARLVPPAFPPAPVAPAELPAVEAGGHIRYLPSGWRCRTASGRVVAGIGGIEPGRLAQYHPLAYMDADAVLHLLEQPPADVLVTHQGPAGPAGDDGSESLQLLLEAGGPRVWFHGHSMARPEMVRAGPGSRTLVVPLGDIAFAGRGPAADDPGEMGWAVLDAGEDFAVRRERPDFWRDYRRRKWTAVDERRLVCPDLARRL